MSVEILFMIRPMGVVSKKAIGARSRQLIILSWRRLLAWMVLSQYRKL